MSSIFHPNSSVTQNYLKDPRLVATLIERSNLDRDDVVYEIGPGKGIITGQLARHCEQVIAIEKDARLAALLVEKFAGKSNVTIHAGDFLCYGLPRTAYKVFANIPFNITSAIVNRLTNAQNPPEEAYLAMQKEAADMYLGRPHETLRTVLLKPWFEVELVHRFRRKDFSPEPGVDVVMLRLHKRRPPLVCHADRQRFRDFVVYGFTTWRPTLGHILKGVFTRPQLKRLKREMKIDLQATPTAIAFEQWLDLFAAFKDIGSEQAMRRIAGCEQRLIRQQKGLQKVNRTRKKEGIRDW